MRNSAIYGVLCLLLALVATACSGANPVHFFNGFDFDVDATITSGGDTKTVTIAARGREDVEVFGKTTVEIKAGDGTVLSKREIEFLSKEERVDKQRELYNVLGAAALKRTEVAYGIAGSPATYTLSGVWHKVQITWFFEPPPDAISVEEGNQGMTLNALGYAGDGSWRTTVMQRIDKAREYKDDEVLGRSEPGRQLAKVRDIITTVLAHDPSKPDMSQIEAAYEELGFVYPPRLAKR